MGHNLALEVTAEGVDSKQQVQFLRARGCSIFQGYLFGRPVGADDLETLLRTPQRFELGPHSDLAMQRAVDRAASGDLEEPGALLVAKRAAK